MTLQPHRSVGHPSKPHSPTCACLSLISPRRPLPAGARAASPQGSCSRACSRRCSFSSGRRGLSVEPAPAQSMRRAAPVATRQPRDMGRDLLRSVAVPWAEPVRCGANRCDCQAIAQRRSRSRRHDGTPMLIALLLLSRRPHTGAFPRPGMRPVPGGLPVTAAPSPSANGLELGGIGEREFGNHVRDFGASHVAGG